MRLSLLFASIQAAAAPVSAAELVVLPAVGPKPLAGALDRVIASASWPIPSRAAPPALKAIGARCQGKVMCLAAVGTRAAGQFVLAPRVDGKGKKKRIEIVLVDVAAAAMLHAVELHLPAPALPEALAPLLAELAAKLPGGSPQPAAPDPTPLDEPPLLSGVPPADASLLAAAPDEDAAAQQTSAGAAPPDADGTPPITSEPLPPAAVAAVDDQWSPTWRTWGGAALAAGGGALLVFGMTERSRAVELANIEADTTQLDVVAQEHEQHAAATRSSVMVGGGLAAVALAVVVFVWDLARTPEAPELVTAQDGAAMVWRW